MRCCRTFPGSGSASRSGPAAIGLLIAPAGLNWSGDKPAPAAVYALFARYAPQVAPHIEPLSTAQTAFQLLSALVNAPNLDDRGLQQTASLARGVIGYEATYTRISPSSSR